MMPIWNYVIFSMLAKIVKSFSLFILPENGNETMTMWQWLFYLQCIPLFQLFLNIKDKKCEL